MDDSIMIIADQSAEKINSVIQLTGTLVSSVHEYLWGVDEAAHAPHEELLDELHSMGKILAQLRKHTLGDSEFRSSVLNKLSSLDGPLSECAAEMDRLRVKIRSDSKDPTWLSDKQQVLPFISRLEKHKGVFALALQLVKDQSKLSEVIAGYGQARNDKLRLSTAIYNPQVHIVLIAEERKRELEWLYSGNVENRYLGIHERRLKGTGEWLFKSPIFQRWMKGDPGFLLLWGRAIAGAGKSYISSKIIDHIKTQAPKQNYAVAYVFFDSTELNPEQPNEVLSSLIQQVACQSPSFPIISRILWSRLKDRQVQPNLQKLARNLIETSKFFDRVFLILDGLDEYEKREDFLPLLHTLGKSKINVFITSQPQPVDMQISLQTVAKIDLLATSEDIKILIEHRIDNNMPLKRLLAEEKNRNEFISKLASCANGIFLFAHLLIRPLTLQPTVKHIFKVLERFKALTQGGDSYLSVYKEVIGIVCNQSKNCHTMALKILTWLAKAQRTLTTGELREAISVEAERYKLEESDLPDKETMLDICAGLITIDQESNQVRLIHHTARECLIQGHILPSDADCQVAMTCITYASFDVFSWRSRSWDQRPDIPWEDRLKLHPFFKYAAKYLSTHINSCDQSLTTKPFSRFTNDSNLMSCVLRILEIDCEAKEVSALHVAALLGHVPVVRELLKKKRERLDQDKAGRTVLHYAVRENHKEIVRLLLEDGRTERQNTSKWELTELNIDDQEGKTVLHWAARKGFKDIVRLLLQSGADIESRGQGSQTALHEAARGGHLEIVKLLIQLGARVWVREEVGQTALHVAAEAGHLEIVEHLLGHVNNVSPEDQRHASQHRVEERDHELYRQVIRTVDLRIGVSCDDHELQTPLHLAALGSHTAIVHLLLGEGADVQAQDTSLETPLHQAARGGDETIIQLLVDYGADVLAETRLGVTVLHRAATRGYADIVKILLDHGADVSSPSAFSIGLSSAIDSGDEQTVHLLLENSKDLSIPAKVDEMLVKAAEAGCGSIVELLFNHGAKTSSTALYTAVRKGYRNVVKILLDGGADILLRHRGQTLLHIAAYHGHDDVVQLLLENGSEVGALSQKQQTALHSAAYNSKHKSNATVIHHLLEAGVDISAKDDCGQTALILAAKGGPLEAVRILIANGAETSVFDINGWTALHQAAYKDYYGEYRDQTGVIKLLLDNGANISSRNQSHQTALLLAVSTYNNNKVIHTLLERGADINDTDKESRTALMVSIVEKRPEATKLLVEQGADISRRDEKNRTAFMCAVKKGVTEVVKILIEKGADITEQDEKGQTAFMIAVAAGDYGIVELLLKNGARVTEKDGEGQSALFVAAREGHLEVVRVLLERGADISETNAEGQTALFMAADFHPEVFYFLVEKGINQFARDHHGNLATLDRDDDDDGGWSPPEPWYPHGW